MDDEDETVRSYRSTSSDISSEDSDYTYSNEKRKRSNFRLRSRSQRQPILIQQQSRIFPARSPKRCLELPLQQERQSRIVFDLESSPKPLQQPISVVITKPLEITPAACVPQYDICKYYLKNTCHRSDCNFMHSDFPCKYYYLGLKCPAKDCLYLHGGVLSDFLKKVLVDHIQSASPSVLGKFNRYGRFKAGKLIDEFNQQLKNGVVNPVFINEPAAKKTRWDVKSDNYLNLNKLERLLNSQQIQLLADKNIYSLDECKSLTIRQLKELNFTDAMIEDLLLNIKNLKDLEIPVNTCKLQSDELPIFSNPEKIQTPNSIDNLFSFSNHGTDDMPSFSVPHYQMNLGQYIGNGSPDHSEFSEGSEQQLVIDEEFEKDEEFEEPTVTNEIKCYSVREADSTNEDQTEEHRYDSFVSYKKIESKIEIQVNKVDSDNSAEKTLFEPDDERFPFKPFLTDFIPATEIFASINSHSLIEYKLIEVEVPRITKKIENFCILDPRMKFYNIDDEFVSSN